MSTDVILEDFLKAATPSINHREFYQRYLATIREYLEKGASEAIKVWIIEVAITPFNEVDCLDDEGVVVFKIPPILAPFEPLQSEKQNERIASITGMVEKLNHTVPGRGNQLFSDMIIDRVNIPQSKIDGYRARWDEIFKYYDEPTPFSTNDVTNTSTVATEWEEIGEDEP